MFLQKLATTTMRSEFILQRNLYNYTPIITGDLNSPINIIENPVKSTLSRQIHSRSISTRKRLAVPGLYARGLADEPTKPSSFFGAQHTALKGKVAVITGGTSGIGLAVAKDLIHNNVSRVIVSGRDIATGSKAVKKLNKMCAPHQKSIYVPMDVTVKEELKELFTYTVENHGGLDILMNSAGILNESSMWRKMVDTNVRALIDSTRLGMDLMKNPKRPGVIVNMSAICAIKPLPQLPIFSATKAAVLNATRAFSKINDSNVRFLIACMGPTNTPMLLNFAENEIGDWAKDRQEQLLNALKAKQNADKAARCITLMMQYANSGSVYLVFNGQLRKRENEQAFSYTKNLYNHFR